MDHAGEFVPGHLAHVGTGVVVVVAPVVEVGAADRRRGVLDEDPAGLDLGRRQGLERERLPGLIENDGQSFGHRELLLRRWRLSYVTCAASRSSPPCSSRSPVQRPPNPYAFRAPMVRPRSSATSIYRPASRPSLPSSSFTDARARTRRSRTV